MSIPKNVVIPKSSGQFSKLQEGVNRFRILSNVITGWEGWKDKKPFRHEGDICKIKPEYVDNNKDGKPNINYFWAMAVWNYKENKVQVLTITQKTIMGAFLQLEENIEDFGDLKNYDVIINKSKVGDKTSYTVQGTPSKPLSEEIKTAYMESKVDLNTLFAGGYPINNTSEEVEEEVPF